MDWVNGGYWPQDARFPRVFPDWPETLTYYVS
jgi:hypothetical protein